MSTVAEEPTTARGWARHRGAAVAGLILFFIAGAFALSVDVVRAGYGIKGDEATYVSMALSVAYDHDPSPDAAPARSATTPASPGTPAATEP